MQPIVTRRTFVCASSLLGLAPMVLAAGHRTESASGARRDDAWAAFPRQPLELVSAVVGASHRDLGRVRELVEARPELAKAAWDGGFGDWETALGAASHTGQREIALYLMEHGARPDIFTFAMLGNLAAVKGMIEGSPGVQRIPGPHGISLLRHARAGGEEAAEVTAYLESLGDAGEQPVAVPLSSEEMAAYMGTYRIEAAGGLTFEIKESRASLWFQRGEMGQRGLRHLGGHAFSPVGADAVRLVFEVDAGKAGAVAILDGGPAMRGVRVG